MGAAVLRPYKEKREERRESLLLGRRRGGGDGGVANGGAVDDELDAAVSLATFGGGLGGDRLRLAEAAGRGGGGPGALVREKIRDAGRPAFCNLPISIPGAPPFRST